MLKRLRVRNFAVVEEAEAEFCPGLNVITGETGAGKSVIIGALALVAGGRADASIVRDGAKEAEVEAEFSDGLGSRGRSFTARRTVTTEGRSRAWIDDESVSISELRAACAGLVDMHGPQDNRLLAEESFQRDAIDSFGSIDKSAYAAAYARFSDAKAALDDLKSSGGEEEIDLLRYQTSELEVAGLSDDDENIAQRHAAAAHAEEIVESANEITELLGGDGGASRIFAALRPKFAAIARHLPEAEAWSAELDELSVRTEELSRSVADAASAADCGEEDFESLDRRLTLVNKLRRKYLQGGGESPVSELIALLDAKKKRLADLESRDERIAELEKSVAAAEKEVRKAGALLSKKRSAAASRLSKAVDAQLRDLGFSAAAFSVAIEEADPGPSGTDRVTYVFSPNAGEPPRPLADIASSGELSRVMLALKAVIGAGGKATVVFDEIDANIGGETGKIVGEKMRTVAKQSQVVAITHLPQSAACGERHLVVSKGVSGGRTRTSIRVVEGEDRVSEIARMLGGEKLTSVARRHAKELLDVSR